MKIPAEVRLVLAQLGYDDDDTNLSEWLRTTEGGNYAKILGRSIKVDLGKAKGVLTAVCYMSPARESGVNLFPWATRGCAKSLRYYLFRELFLADLRVELDRFIVKATKQGKKPAIRLNGSTDILWEYTGILHEYPDLTFYDYTKAGRRKIPANYHLTYSISERTGSWVTATEYLDRGGNAALVVRNKAQARHLIQYGYRGYPVIDGDIDDIRFNDLPGHVVVLYAKGTAVNDSSGFVVDVDVDARIAA